MVRRVTFLLFLGIIIVLVAVWLLAPQKKTVVIAEDTIIEGDYAVASDETLILENGAILDVQGDLSIDGAIQAPEGFMVVARSNVDMSEDARIEFAGNFQFVDSRDALLLNDSEIQEAFEEAGQKSEDIPSFGPFTDNPDDITNLQDLLNEEEESESTYIRPVHPLFVNVAHAQTDPTDKDKYYIGKNSKNAKQKELPDKTIKISGEIFGTQKKDSKDGKIILFRFGAGKTELHLKNFNVTAPDGKSGKGDENKQCRAKGSDGKKGARIRLHAWSIRVNDATFHLANGGDGGDASTPEKGCKKAEAIGGYGAEAGNIKITTTNTFDITGGLSIFPGRSGDGGSADAVGGDGAKDGDGGDAEAVGGDASDNIKYLFISGDVKKSLKVFGVVLVKDGLKIGDVYTGNGGNAFARGGKGDDGQKCSEDGKKGGVASAFGGRGGNAAKASFFGTPYKTFGGSGGSIEVESGIGGDGADGCATTAQGSPAGGHGGNGGVVDASAVGLGGAGDTAGKGGQSSVIPGDGGDGGNGCPSGIGGDAGKNYSSLATTYEAKDGKDGKKTCPDTQAEEKDTNVLPGDLAQDPVSNTNTDDTHTGVCVVPDDVLLQAYPSDVFSRSTQGDATVTFTRQSCVSKSESSVRRAAEVWLGSFQEFCPNSRIASVSFSGRGNPCSVTFNFSE